jgi:hypothetical protein
MVYPRPRDAAAKSSHQLQVLAYGVLGVAAHGEDLLSIEEPDAPEM